MSNPWHERTAAGAAYVLDPEFANHQQESNKEVMEGFMETLEKVAILVEVRRQLEASDESLRQQRTESDPCYAAGRTGSSAAWRGVAPSIGVSGTALGPF